MRGKRDPGKRPNPDKIVRIIDYLPKEPSKPKPKGLSIGRVKINSSTFDTLLSSQGSSAHLAQPLGLALGQLDQTYRSGLGLSNWLSASIGSWHTAPLSAFRSRLSAHA
jgi:hypothetical protein